MSRHHSICVIDLRGPDDGAVPEWVLRIVYAISKLEGRRVTTVASPQLAELIRHQVELAYSRVDAVGSLREVRISAIDVAPI